MRKKIGIYPGSFNPWHEGHTNILKKASKIFDKIVIVQAINPEKPILRGLDILKIQIAEELKCWDDNIKVIQHEGLLSDLKFKYDAIIRGLRNGYDLQYEMNQQYWYEDTGISVPIVLFICDRDLTHISSSSIRALKKLELISKKIRT
jgi:pantetheine-phosphate adenylyltransferase